MLGNVPKLRKEKYQIQDVRTGFMILNTVLFATAFFKNKHWKGDTPVRSKDEVTM